MTILEEIYAGTNTDNIIHALDIRIAGREPIRFCNGYVDTQLFVDGLLHTFEAGSLHVQLPKRNASGTQKLTFGVWNTTGLARKYVDEALETGEPVIAHYYEFLESNRMQPYYSLLNMSVKGSKFDGIIVSFECSYKDLLNTLFPRDRYTALTARGISYL